MAMNMASQTDPATDAACPPPQSPPPGPEEIARFFPAFEILELLGRGGMGLVYKARQKSLNRLVALKILAPEREKDPSFARRFAVEAETLAKLGHPNIVTVHDFGQTDGLFYLVMEFVDGVSLRQVLQSGRMAPREALAIVPQICDALQYAHDHGIVHRDIKPDNILLDRRGHVKVADFGLARLVAARAQPAGPAANFFGTATLTEAGKIMGTPQYMAPEQKERPTEVDHRADIYALGVVLYQMLTGELPDKRLEPPSKKVLVDVRLDEVVLRALEDDPARRYQQASVFKTDLETIAGTRAPNQQLASSPGNSSAGQKPEPRHPHEAVAPSLLRAAIKRVLLRFLLFASAIILAREVFERISMHWKESEQEVWLIPFLLVSMLLAVWVAWPLFRWRRSLLAWTAALAGVVVVYLAAWGFNMFYSGWIAPSLGLYYEPDWVSDLPGWQRTHRLGIAKHLWNRKSVAPQFAPASDLTLSVNDQDTVRLLSLASGKIIARQTLAEPGIENLIRQENLDLAVLAKGTNWSVLGLRLQVLPVPDRFWETNAPQDVADVWLLETRRPKFSTVLWPPEQHWNIERHQATEFMPQWENGASSSTFYFLTPGRDMGLLQISGLTDDPRSLKIRYKLVQRASLKAL